MIVDCIVILVDKVHCYDNKGPWTTNDNINEYCWNNFSSAIEVSKGTYKIGPFLPHKLFPIITICEAISMLLPLFIWSWCFGKNFENQISAVIDQSNNLTEYYRMYDKGVRRTVTEASLHRELENYLELLLSIVMHKMPRIFVLYVLKWVFVLIFSIIWIAGQVVVHFPDMNIFVGSFLCVSIDGKSASTCSIPTSTFLRAVWYINIAFLGLVLICSIAGLIILARGNTFTSTFFFSHVPGAMDTRVADCMEETFSKPQYTLLSRFCEDNTQLCNDPGMSRSLSRKYGVRDGFTPGRETIMEKHFPVIQPEQIRKFRLACEQYKTKKYNKDKGRAKPKVRFARGNSDPETISIYSNPESIVGSMSFRGKPTKRPNKNKIQHIDRDFYLTPRLMQRKMAQDLKSIKSSSKFSSSNTSQRTPRSISSIDLHKMTPRSSTPISDRSRRQGAVKRQGNQIQNVDPQTTGHYPVYAGRSREFNPFAYRLHNLIMQANAKNTNSWKP